MYNSHIIVKSSMHSIINIHLLTGNYVPHCLDITNNTSFTQVINSKHHSLNFLVKTEYLDPQPSELSLVDRLGYYKNSAVRIVNYSIRTSASLSVLVAPKSKELNASIFIPSLKDSETKV